MKDYIRLLRPTHYLKNVLVVLPLFFSGRFFEGQLLIKAAAGFAAFCLLSSFIYIINDVRDVESDRRHPTKCKRPIASGAVSIHSALVIAAVLFAAATAICVLMHFPLNGWACMAAYFVVNLGYSFGLKNVPILDVALLVSGFLLRVLLGSAVTGIVISNWLYLTVVSVSFYLALGKRRGEMRRQSGTTRKVLKYYNNEFLDKNMNICLTLAIVFYSLWTADTANAQTHLIWTVPLVICLCLKYYLTIDGNSDGDPIEVIFQDKVLLALIAAFAILTVVLLYLV